MTSNQDPSQGPGGELCHSVSGEADGYRRGDGHPADS